MIGAVPPLEDVPFVLSSILHPPASASVLEALRAWGPAAPQTPLVLSHSHARDWELLHAMQSGGALPASGLTLVSLAEGPALLPPAESALAALSPVYLSLQPPTVPCPQRRPRTRPPTPAPPARSPRAARAFRCSAAAPGSSRWPRRGAGQWTACSPSRPPRTSATSCSSRRAARRPSEARDARARAAPHAAHAGRGVRRGTT